MSDVVALRVLLIEDDAEDATLTARMLSSMRGYRVDVRVQTTFDAGARALRCGDFDLVVLDHLLGARTGIELLHEVYGEACSSVPVVLLTGVASDAIDIEASALGVATLLEKNALSPTMLARTVRYALERGRAERALRSARAFFRAGFDAVEDHVAILSRDGRIVEVNAAWLRFAGENGIPADHVWRGVNYLEACQSAAESDGLARAARAGIHDILTGSRESFQLEYPCHAPGTERWFLLRAVRFEDGGQQYVYVAHSDITQQHLASRALHESEVRYRRLVEAALEGICEVDRVGAITFVNGRLAQMLGYEIQELLGRPIFDFMEERTSFDARTRFARQQRGLSEIVELEFRRKDGDTVWVHKAASPQFDQRGEYTGAVYLLSDITQRLAAQRKLVASEHLFRALTERSSDIVTVLDETGRIRYHNGAFSRLLGVPDRDACGESGFDYAHPDDREAIISLFAGLFHEPGTMITAEYRVIPRSGGAPRILRSIAQNLLHDDAVQGIVVNSDDVTEQREAETGLRESAQRYRVLFEENPVPSWVVDPATRQFLAVNEAAVAMYGYTKEEFLAMQVDELRPPEYRHEFVRKFEALVRGRVGVIRGPSTTPHMKKDGTVLEVDLTHDAVQFGGRSALLVLANDVTEHRRAQAELMFRAHLLDAVEQAVIATTLDGTVTYWNRSAERLYGWSAEEVLGRAITDLTPLDSTREQAAQIMQRLARGESWSGEFQVRSRDGRQFPAQVSDSPLFDASGNLIGVVGISHDISARRGLEEQLRQAQKMEAVGQLAGGVAHDFNNLLTVITSYTAMLLAELPSEDPIRTDLREVAAASDRAAGLTRQLLAFSRRQVLQPRVVDLGQLIGDMAKMLGRVIGEDIVLEVTTTEEPAEVLADAGQLEQVLMNLAVNARDAMPRGGRLEIDVSLASLTDGDREQYHYVAAGEYVRVNVRDTGCGMDEATQARIFEPFFTTKEPGKGTGLGLATVYGIVKQSNGYVWATSEPGKGTTFSVYLPRSAPVVEAASPAPTVQGLPERASATVLVAEDEHAVRSIIERVLRRRGYTVLSAPSGPAALEVLSQHEGTIDLLVTDVVMPHMSGQELADRVLDLQPESAVLFMTGYSMDAVDHHGVLRSGAPLLKKPFTPYDLALAVSELLQERGRRSDARGAAPGGFD